MTRADIRGTVKGRVDGVAVEAGSVGEKITSSVALAGAVSMTSGTTHNLTSISVTPGIWMLYANTEINLEGVLSYFQFGFSKTSASLPSNRCVPTSEGEMNAYMVTGAASGQAQYVGLTVPSIITTNVTMYFVCRAFFTSTAGLYGKITAIRIA